MDVTWRPRHFTNNDLWFSNTITAVVVLRVEFTTRFSSNIDIGKSHAKLLGSHFADPSIISMQSADMKLFGVERPTARS